jgi:hypothetical protein
MNCRIFSYKFRNKTMRPSIFLNSLVLPKYNPLPEIARSLDLHRSLVVQPRGPKPIHAATVGYNLQAL